jgi:hypothetical protein
MEPKCSLARSKEPAASPHPELRASSQHHHTLILSDKFVAYVPDFEKIKGSF